MPLQSVKLCNQSSSLSFPSCGHHCHRHMFVRRRHHWDRHHGFNRGHHPITSAPTHSFFWMFVFGCFDFVEFSHQVVNKERFWSLHIWRIHLGLVLLFRYVFREWENFKNVILIFVTLFLIPQFIWNLFLVWSISFFDFLCFNQTMN